MSSGGWCLVETHQNSRIVQSRNVQNAQVFTFKGGSLAGDVTGSHITTRSPAPLAELETNQKWSLGVTNRWQPLPTFCPRLVIQSFVQCQRRMLQTECLCPPKFICWNPAGLELMSIPMPQLLTWVGSHYPVPPASPTGVRVPSHIIASLGFSALWPAPCPVQTRFCSKAVMPDNTGHHQVIDAVFSTAHAMLTSSTRKCGSRLHEELCHKTCDFEQAKQSIKCGEEPTNKS